MGKDLHYSIRPYIENALNGHNKIISIQKIDLEDYYAYKIKRVNMSDVILVLSDDYNFNNISLYSKPALLKNGGFFLIARPEANNNYFKSIPEEKLLVGKLRILLGALNREDFWNYKPKTKEE